MPQDPLLDDLQELIDGLARRLGQSVAVDAPSGDLIAVTRDYGDADPYRMDLLLQRRTPSSARSYFAECMRRSTPEAPAFLQRNAELSIEPRWCFNLGEGLAYLWIMDRGHQPDHSVIARFAEPIVQALKRRSLRAAEETPMPHPIRLRALLRGQSRSSSQPDTGAEYAVLCLSRSEASTTTDVGDRLAELGKASTYFSARPATRVDDPGFSAMVLEASGCSGQGLRGTLNDLLAITSREPSRGVVGVSEPGPLSSLQTLYAQSAAASTIGNEIFRSEGMVPWNDVAGFVRELSRPVRATSASRSDRFAALLRDRDGFAFDTVAALLRSQHGESPAALLQVHRTTILYRQRQIALLSGIDLARGNDRFLGTALWLSELCRRRLPPELLAQLVHQPEG